MMFKKPLLTIWFLLRLMAISTAAHAGSTITDKSYWPDEARQSTENQSGDWQSDFNSALAYDRSLPNSQPATNANDSGYAWRYQGGPKSP
jgi:hypothetical protein